ncbi:SelL-related redox protein [Fuerstiella marisgermanici]|uniref:AhpC/TSA family protein n=1 Tax=Fuerstiella marisgermanici TaxID=1891926 RepID=A0A1P8WFU4_9PLAN|nr:SelL-related redox protein [Fuerstiella marisgermanici]APZ92939.1 AhpC/TSA family protein [Fuerstiella marisgermanici]
MNTSYHPKQWMKYVLILAGFYNLAWGATAIMLPVHMLGWLGIQSETTAMKFWQCIGMIVGVYGVGYLIAARAPYQHWPMTLVGLLGKVLGPVGFAAAMADGSLPTSLGWTIVTNDLIWWIPFAMILWGAMRYCHATDSAYETPEADDPLKELRANTGERLDDLADAKPQLVVFLRHAGCTFCRQTLADVAAQRKEITAAGCGIVLVHLGGNDESDQQFFQKYGLNDVPRISDPQSRLYRQFGLDLGGFSQLFGLRVWFRGFVAGVLGGHGIGAVRGNSFQMPGVYLYHCRQILGGFRHEISSDRPDYAALARKIEVREPALAS